MYSYIPRRNESGHATQEIAQEVDKNIQKLRKTSAHRLRELRKIQEG